MAAPDASATVDVEAEVAKFLADSSATSLELPNLSAEQRKFARKLATQHPELKCESYGFGAERQLFLSKRASAALGEATPGGSEAAAVRVKNTFIDDWIPEGGDGAPEPVVFRSMPQGLPKHLLEPSDETESKKVDLAPATEHPPPVASTAPAKVDTTSPGASTTASAATGSSSLSPSSAEAPASPASSNRDLHHALPEGVDAERVQVRNTFIHIESAPMDERVVQSMPHGMFRQSLLEESRKGGAAPATGAAAVAAGAAAAPVSVAEAVAAPPMAPPLQQPWVAPPSAPPMAMPPPPMAPATMQPLLAIGSEVMVEGLTKFPAFNGLVGFVQALDEAIGRYDVLLLSPAAPGGRQWAKIKAENLRLLRPAPPPCYAPTVASR